MEIETIKLNDIEYVKKNDIPNINIESSKLVECLIGKYVIIRSRNEGINAGTLVAADETGVVLKDCRRLYYHAPADKSLSWYEGVAVSGVSDNSKVSGTVATKVIIEDYSITAASEKAKESIESMIPHEQN